MVTVNQNAEMLYYIFINNTISNDLCLQTGILSRTTQALAHVLLYSCFLSCHSSFIFRLRAMSCKSLPHLHVKQYVRYPWGWLPTAAASQELVCIFHHYCLISCLCAWRPVLHLTFLKVRQAAHVQQTRGNEVRGKVFTLVIMLVVHVWLWYSFFSPLKNAWESFH